MLIFYRIGNCNLAQKRAQGSEITRADERSLSQSHQAAAHAIKHPLGNL